MCVERLCANVQGFDEFMNVTLDEVEEVRTGAPMERKPLGTFASASLQANHTGRLLLKGDNIVRAGAVVSRVLPRALCLEDVTNTGRL